MESEEGICAYIKEWSQRGSVKLSSMLTSAEGNPHPHRFACFRLKSLVQKFYEGRRDISWMIIPGARGTGKTTMLAQLREYLISEGRIPQEDVLYFALDHAKEFTGASLKDLLIAIQKEYGNFSERKTPFVLMIDEVHVDDSWMAQLKGVYEFSENVLIICTGSSAISLQVNPDITRRVHIEQMVPMGLSEYRMLKEQKWPIKGLKNEIEDALYLSSSATECYTKLLGYKEKVSEYFEDFSEEDIKQYIFRGTLPFTILFDSNNEVFRRVSRTLEQIVNKDLPKYDNFSSKSLQSAIRMLLLVANSQGVISLNKISDTTGISAPIVSKIFEAFILADILLPVKPQVGSATGSLRKITRYHFYSPAYRAALLSIAGLLQPEAIGILLEDVCALYLHKAIKVKPNPRLLDFGYDTREEMPDFCILTEKGIIPLEASWGTSKDERQVRKILDEGKSPYGLVVSKKPLAINIEKDVVYVPIDMFLMS
jgi:uncharacterized protein